MDGVSFGTFHSYEDLHLILEPFTPTPATPQLNLLKIPGRDGLLDLTAANGEVKYNSREFTFNFTVAPDYNGKNFDAIASEVSNALNGLRCSIRLDRDADYFWHGRCSVDKYEQDKNIKRIVVKAVVDPYKYKVAVQNQTGTLSAEKTATIACVNGGKMTTVPRIQCQAAGVIAQFNGVTYTLNAGFNTIPGIRFVKGRNFLYMKGNGTVTIEWQEGDL